MPSTHSPSIRHPSTLGVGTGIFNFTVRAEEQRGGAPIGEVFVGDGQVFEVRVQSCDDSATCHGGTCLYDSPFDGNFSCDCSGTSRTGSSCDVERFTVNWTTVHSHTATLNHPFLLLAPGEGLVTWTPLVCELTPLDVTYEAVGLPCGLSMNNVTAIIEGTPSVSGIYHYHIFARVDHRRLEGCRGGESSDATEVERRRRRRSTEDAEELEDEALGDLETAIVNQAQFVLDVRDCTDKASCDGFPCLDDTPHDGVFQCACDDPDNPKCAASAAQQTTTTVVTTGLSSSFLVVVLLVIAVIYLRRRRRQNQAFNFDGVLRRFSKDGASAGLHFAYRSNAGSPVSSHLLCHLLGVRTSSLTCLPNSVHGTGPAPPRRPMLPLRIPGLLEVTPGQDMDQPREIRRRFIIPVYQIGEGQFGEVNKGILDEPGHPPLTVAIKVGARHRQGSSLGRGIGCPTAMAHDNASFGRLSHPQTQPQTQTHARVHPHAVRVPPRR